ncbi:EAL domain-containing protein [Paenibacillus piri]|uniref:EAL domain-containing protein n=1 Tax=Paenibacillus piri TaxID=2547395 RepID=A0A4R5KQS7_9BACL|nr:EAL domain-containing protein [Paenibacillus piri]TDF97117.1 EAL domain-containing protein [Paenibacillus piri]
MSWLQIVTSFIRNFTDIAIFIVLINHLRPHAMKLSKKLQDMILGVTFGISSIISMQIPLVVADGVILDLRNVSVAAAGTYGGWRSALLAVVFAGGYRVLLGGAGWEPGLGGIATCAILGVVYKELEKRGIIPTTLGTDLLFGASIAVASFAWSLMLPVPVTVSIASHFLLPMMIISSLATAGFRHFIVEWHNTGSYFRDLAAHPWNAKASVERLQHYLDHSGTTDAVCIVHISNVQLAYPFADDLMKSVYQRLTSLLPRGFVARIRENELICSLTASPDPERLLSQASHIQQKLSEPVIVRNRPVHINALLGIAAYNGQETAEMLIQHADAALRHMKEQGHSHTMIYHEKLLQQQLYRFKLEQGLQQALANNELELHFQPQFQMQTGRVRGFEALLRWRHPELGAVPPGEFIPIAEENGMIVPIGLWVLRRACELHGTLFKAAFPDAVICVNISALQLNETHFPELVSQILSETGLPPRLLELEITESMLIASIDSANDRLEELSRLGIRIALDDFGTGYSSLHYLSRLPLHLVKLDKSFIRDICKNNEGRITQSIIRLLQDLDIHVVAEGVESYDQLHRLAAWKCDIVQGYLLSKPLSEEAVPAFAAKQRTDAALVR